MGRPSRVALGGLVYHVINRANGGMRLFESDADYAAFERVLAEANERVTMRILAYCVMPNHWHFVLWPRRDGELSRFMAWLTLTHTQRWHAHHQSAGSGHVYQGRFKSFVVQTNDHLLTVCRYVERNPLRAGLVRRAEDWRWGSLWRGEFGNAEEKALLGDWPLARPKGWRAYVNQAQTAPELDALRRCIQRGQPFGGATWTARTAERLGLTSTLRPSGRPRERA